MLTGIGIGTRFSAGLANAGRFPAQHRWPSRKQLNSLARLDYCPARFLQRRLDQPGGIFLSLLFSAMRFFPRLAMLKPILAATAATLRVMRHFAAIDNINFGYGGVCTKRNTSSEF